MLTKVGRVLLGLVFNPDTYPFPAANRYYFSDKCTIPGKNFNGDELYFAVRPGSISYGVSGTAVSAGTSGWLFGSGTTPATEDDYTIESQITGITGTYSSDNYMQYNSDTESWDLFFQYTINNPTENDVVISEMCRFITIAKGTTKGGASSGTTSVMLERVVLDNPVTVPAGEASVINYTFSKPCVIEDPEPEVEE